MVVGRDRVRSSKPASVSSPRATTSYFALDLLLAFAGAVIFSFPMLMTMEMWWLGFSVDSFRLALFVVLAMPLLVGLSFYWGVAENRPGKLEVIDVFFAYAVGFAASALLLWLFAIIGPGMSAEEIIGKITLQAVLASIGAILGRHQLGRSAGTGGAGRKARQGYGGRLVVMSVGAIFLSSSLASTEEMVLIAYKMTDLRALALVAATLSVMHIFMQIGASRERNPIAASLPTWSLFVRFTVVGYAIALLVGAYALWMFGRMEGTGIVENVRAAVVLGFPAALGAAASQSLL